MAQRSNSEPLSFVGKSSSVRPELTAHLLLLPFLAPPTNVTTVGVA
jgi:hypothetical protein